MKKKIIVLMLLSVCLSSGAQKFLRYQMNNNTYNGFYTFGIESIIHDYKNGIATTFVNASGKVYEIPIENIDCISVEDANISNDNIGQYRIYEFNYEEGDIKKIFVDNRASLFASHNGDFGANDTILFSSAYNGIAWFFYTDDLGRIKKFFDGNSLMFIDYDSEDEFTVLDLLSNTTNHYNLTSSQACSLSRAPSSQDISRFVRSFIQHIQQIGTREGQSVQSALELAKNLEVVQNNPELHNLLLFSDWVSVGQDVLSIGASVLGGIPTGGASLAEFGLSVGSLFSDIVNLVNDTWPDSEQMQKYRDYYQKKYSIHVAAIAAENVSYTSATLRGEATSLEGLNGTFTFRLYGENDETLSGTKNNVTNNSCIITANASKLKPGWPYFYSVQYTCVVDGLQLVFYSENIAEFTTLSPDVYTGEVKSKSTDKAEVTCKFYNVPKGAVCGVKYSSSTEINEKKASYTNDGEYYFTLAPLQPNTTYTYQAFVVIDGIYFYANDAKQFKTDSETDSKPIYSGCPDGNHPHWIDLGLPSGTLWSCCNVGATSPEKIGEYFTCVQIGRGQVSNVPSKEQIEELITYSHFMPGTWMGVKGGEFYEYGEELENGIFIINPKCTIFLPGGTEYWSSTIYYYDNYGETFSNIYYLWFSTESINHGCNSDSGFASYNRDDGWYNPYFRLVRPVLKK